MAGRILRAFPMLLFLAATALHAGQAPFSILVLTDEEFRAKGGREADVRHAVASTAAAFENEFSIKLSVGRTGEWASDDGLGSLDLLVASLDARVDKKGHDIVVAVTSQECPGERYFGYSLFKEGLIVLRWTGNPASRVKVLRHEMGHLFGAVHVVDPGSLMDVISRGEAFDSRNADIIALNRDRAFHGAGFPLPREGWRETAALLEAIAAANEAAEIPGRREGLEDVHLLLAQIRIELNDTAGAVAACETAVAINPGNLEGRNIKGIALRRGGRLDEAIETYGEILADKPLHPRVHYNLGIALSKKGDPEAALRSYARALEIKPNFTEAHVNRGEIHLRMGRDGEAEAAFRSAIACDSRSALAYSNLAEVHFRRGEYSQAIAGADRALALDPTLPDAHAIRGKVHHKRGELAEARREFERALELDPGYEEAYYNLGNCYLDESRPDEARRMFEQAVRTNPRFAEARASLGYCLLADGEAEGAVREFLRSLELGYESPKLRLNLSTAYLHLGRTGEAVAEAEKTLELEPSFPPALNNLGIACLLMGRTGEAEARFKEALVSDPGNKEALLNLGHLHMGREEFREALRLYLEAAEIDPKDAALHNNIAVVYFKTGEFGKSWDHVQKARALGLEPHPGFVDELKKKIKSPDRARRGIPERPAGMRAPRARE